MADPRPTLLLLPHPPLIQRQHSQYQTLSMRKLRPPLASRIVCCFFSASSRRNAAGTLHCWRRRMRDNSLGHKSMGVEERNRVSGESCSQGMRPRKCWKSKEALIQALTHSLWANKTQSAVSMTSTPITLKLVTEKRACFIWLLTPASAAVFRVGSVICCARRAPFSRRTEADAQSTLSWAQAHHYKGLWLA
eukprot:6209250-Pleurochrysis_carterae.AAC.2